MIQEKAENQQEEEVGEEACFQLWWRCYFSPRYLCRKETQKAQWGPFRALGNTHPKWKNGQLLNIELKPNIAIIDTLQDTIRNIRL